eukprot:CAMPEP_0179013756 /NCGR_PEP_ID=MMETSP0796-20121207/1895_1 /TAXON_ID=73915 /ORGANISM="Pyrodinium bahamense, Strain pbaha01" /LENGTH=145 /DNA_ID=CAMNT_0020709279 /DNA_START=444 /DNA_END=877 /DNA_ORIENTATION=-
MESAARFATSTMSSTAGPWKSALAQAHANNAHKDSCEAALAPCNLRSPKAMPVSAFKLPEGKWSLDISAVAMAQETIVKSVVTNSSAGMPTNRSTTGGSSASASSRAKARATDQATHASTLGRHSETFARAAAAAAATVARTEGG